MDNTSSCSICAAKPVLEEMRPMLAQAEATLQRHLPPTNDPPGSADTYALKSSLLDFRRTLSHVNGSILEADAEVSHMKTMRDNLQTIIHRIETVLHPVRSLAPSILLTIFEWCIPLPTDTIVIYGDYDSLDPASAPWRLSSVCRRWRDIVLSSPRMWSLVSLPMTYYADPPPFPLMFRLGQHLQRSTNVELDIVLFDATRFGSDGALITTSAQHSILPLLLTTTKRWRSLMITCIRTLLDLFTGCPFDQLVCLRMDFLGRVDSDDVISCFQHSAQITHVSVSHAGKVEFPWDGILSYECGIDAGLSRIPQMSSLEQLTIRHYVEDFVVSSFFPIRLPSLLRLSIIDLSPSFARALADVLQTPVLHTIRLHFTLTTFTFPRFRQSPPFCLKNLSIVMHISPMDRSDHLAQLVMFFEMAPHITNLYMSKCVVIPEVLDALSIVKEESGHLLPQLKSLRLDAETIKDDCDRVITLANSRLEELRVVGDLDREWPEDQRESGEASRWRGFCDRVRVIHVLEDDF